MPASVSYTHLDVYKRQEEGDLKVGAPYVEGAVVSGEVVENGKGKKVIIFKYKAKKDYRKKQGHRQPYTMVKIESLGGKAAPKKTAPAKEVKAEAEEVKKMCIRDRNIFGKIKTYFRCKR